MLKQTFYLPPLLLGARINQVGSLARQQARNKEDLIADLTDIAVHHEEWGHVNQVELVKVIEDFNVEEGLMAATDCIGVSCPQRRLSQSRQSDRDHQSREGVCILL